VLRDIETKLLVAASPAAELTSLEQAVRERDFGEAVLGLFHEEADLFLVSFYADGQQTGAPEKLVAGCAAPGLLPGVDGGRKFVVESRGPISC